MIAELVAAAAAPWLRPLAFSLHRHGWHVGQSGTVYTEVGRKHTRIPISTAWAANVVYRDRATSDPPNKTLQRFASSGVVVWAAIEPVSGWPAGGRRVSAHYSLADAYRFPCCEAAYIGGGEWELYGLGPSRAYSVLIRIYWGSPPTVRMKQEAVRAIHALRFPRACSTATSDVDGPTTTSRPSPRAATRPPAQRERSSSR